MNYFRNFPFDTYDNEIIVDLSRRVDFRKTTLSDPYAFHPFMIPGDDRPQDIANFYYGSVAYTWIVHMSIGAIDPYYDWPLDYRNFRRMIKTKYAEKSGESSESAVIAWTQNTQITDNIIYYRLKEDPVIRVNPLSFQKDAELQSDADNWEPVRYYQYEEEINDDRRSINLLDVRYREQLQNELQELLNAGRP